MFALDMLLQFRVIMSENNHSLECLIHTVAVQIVKNNHYISFRVFLVCIYSSWVANRKGK